MNEQRPPKKTEMIEVRVSHETKRDFLAACRTAGRSASDVIRESMQSFIDSQAQSPEAAGQDVVPFRERLLKKRYLAVAVAATGVAGLAALPSAAAPDFAGMFERLDADSDGVLSVEEFLASRPDAKTMEVRMLRRASADTGQDKAPVLFLLPSGADVETIQQLPDVRFQAVGSGPLAVNMEEVKRQAFARFDADGDGHVSIAEYQVRQMSLLENGFRRLDKDGDGAVSAAEYSAMGEPVLLTPAGSEPLLGVTGKYGPVVTPDSIDSEFAKLDANKDGKLSLDEYLPRK